MEKPREFWLIKNGDEALVFEYEPTHGAIKGLSIHVIEYSTYEKLAQDKMSNDSDYFKLQGRVARLEAALQRCKEKSMELIRHYSYELFDSIDAEDCEKQLDTILEQEQERG